MLQVCQDAFVQLLLHTCAFGCMQLELAQGLPQSPLMRVLAFAQCVSRQLQRSKVCLSCLLFVSSVHVGSRTKHVCTFAACSRRVCLFAGSQGKQGVSCPGVRANGVHRTSLLYGQQEQGKVHRTSLLYGQQEQGKKYLLSTLRLR